MSAHRQENERRRPIVAWYAVRRAALMVIIQSSRGSDGG